MSLEKVVHIIDDILEFLDDYEYENTYVDLSKCADSNIFGSGEIEGQPFYDVWDLISDYKGLDRDMGDTDAKLHVFKHDKDVISLVRQKQRDIRGDSWSESFAKTAKFEDLALLGSICELLKEFEEAKKAYECALNIQESGFARYNLELVNRELSSKEIRDRQLGAPKLTSEPITVDRRPASGLSVGEFKEKYGRQSMPVIITGMRNEIIKGEWTLEWLNERIGEKMVGISRINKKSVGFAQLDRDGVVRFQEFYDRLKNPDSDGEIHQLYLNDCPLPKYLSSLLPFFSLPKYFADDYIKRMPDGYYFQHDWPSMFIGLKGTGSSLHIDSFNANFWMLQVEGRKKWVFFHPDDVPFLYPTWERGTMDPNFPPLEDLRANPKYHLFHRARQYEIILEPGEVLFVPAGTPHYVDNLTLTIALSGNYIDDTNAEKAFSEMNLIGLKRSHVKRFVDLAEKIEFPSDNDMQCYSIDQMVVPYEQLGNH